MPAFFSPLSDPPQWTYTTEALLVPAGLRYGGYTLRAIRATTATAREVRLPAYGTLRRAAAGDGRVFVELQVNPLSLRPLLRQLNGGVPTFYLVFADDSGLSFSAADTGQGNTVLRTATTVSVALGFQDRIVRDPLRWADELLGAMSGVGDDTASWSAFHAAANGAVGGENLAVLLLDGAGQPIEELEVELRIAGSTHTVGLIAADQGDLTRAMARLNAAGSLPLPSPWAGGSSSFRLRPLGGSGTDYQLARLEDGQHAATEIVVTPAARHIQLTNVIDWFAPQFAIPSGMTTSPLARYSRQNRLRLFINGPEFLDDLFRELNAADGADTGFHHVGYLIFAQTDFTPRPDGTEPAQFGTTLEEALRRVGGRSCLLPARFYQFELSDDSSTVVPAVLIVNMLLVTGLTILDAYEVDWLATDPVGIVLVMTTVVGAPIIVQILFDTEGDFLEPNRATLSLLDGMDDVRALLSTYPVNVSDNPRASGTGEFPFDTLFDITDRFGIHHQKFSILRNNQGYIAYCGGIDLNPNRLDDAFHMARGPYHDTHARVEGPAVRDMAITFEQRWAHDGGTPAELGFTAPAANTLLGSDPGADIVQVARTYFRTDDPARRFGFAPLGDRTILDSTLRGIAQAREFIYIQDQYFTPPPEYRAALLQKVSSGEIKKLIIVVPEVTDQPFGDIERGQFIEELRAADSTGTIVVAGFPRRHYTTNNSSMRASAGRMLLMEDMDESPGIDPVIMLGPPPRLPAIPFYVAVEGELMYVTGIAEELPNPATDQLRICRVLRGEALPLIEGGSSPKGPKMKSHKKGAAATAVDLKGIYVHAKTIVIDDLYVGIGSANVNRRGFYHDSEAHWFALPAGLRTDPTHAITRYRQRLWAEMLNLPEAMALPLLRDPVAAAALFGRSPLQGNRFANLDARPTQFLAGIGNGAGLAQQLLGALVAVTGFDHDRFFASVVDPTTHLEPLTP